MAIDFSDITKITLDYFYRNPDSILAGLTAAAMNDDRETCRDILEECRKRNIDIAKLLHDDLVRHKTLWGKIR